MLLCQVDALTNYNNKNLNLKPGNTSKLVNLSMKNSLKIGVFLACIVNSSILYSQSDSLGLPGDNLDLRAVLSIFKQSSTIEDFERKLNSADSKVNNLDLNNDGQVDYLRVVDYGKEDFHTIVIQDPVSKTESQDVAVIQIVKKEDQTAHLQIVGDETLYGKDYIIEPSDQGPLNSNNTNSRKNNHVDDVYAEPNSSGTTHVMVNVWSWPSVTYIYSPGYTYWVSPWYWGYYPGWYSPWRPYGWHVYHRGWVGYNYGFYCYRRPYYAFPHAHNYYYGRRTSSGYVQKTAPNYGRRHNTAYDNGRKPQQKNSANTGSGTDRVRTNSSGSGNRKQTTTTQNNRTQGNKQTRTQGSSTQKQPQQRSSGTKVNSAPRSGGGNSGSQRSGGGSHSGGGRSSTGRR